MNLLDFKFRQILEVNKRSSLASSKEDLYFCMCRHIVSNQHEKETTGFNFGDVKRALDNEVNDDANIEILLSDLVTEGYIEVKNKKFYIK